MTKMYLATILALTLASLCSAQTSAFGALPKCAVRLVLAILPIH